MATKKTNAIATVAAQQNDKYVTEKSLKVTLKNQKTYIDNLVNWFEA